MWRVEGHVLISSGVNSFFSPLYSTSMTGLSPALALTVKGQCFMSA
jgi:hypothetical protein